jgi:hypothetical protein
MTNNMPLNRKFVLPLLVVFTVCAMSISARAQDDSRAKPVEARFEVLHMTFNFIQVRKADNMREIHTFAYSDRIRDDMQTLFNNGGYQYGDKVKIVYQPGAEIALRIRGRHSKPPKTS